MSTQVQQTKDYSVFKLLDLNRKISKAHVNRLIEMIKEKPNSSEYRPILVNERYEVIDGQHRLKALEQLEAPVHFIMGKGLSVEDAQRLNAIQRNWGPLDYAESYAKGGDQNYQNYLDVRRDYKIPHNTALAYLTDSINVTTLANTFRLGMFQVKDVDKARLNLEMLVEVGDHYPDWRRKQFGMAYLTLIHHPSYNHKHFLSKILKHGRKFATKSELLQDYQRALEKIYNYRTPEEKQIKLF